LRLQARFGSLELPAVAYRSKVRNRCALTGRGGGVVRVGHLSRLEFKRRVLSAQVPGWRQAS
jgi:ribosomal protein S14